MSQFPLSEVGAGHMDVLSQAPANVAPPETEKKPADVPPVADPGDGLSAVCRDIRDQVELHPGLVGKAVEVLRAIFDPEIPVNIYDFGLIYQVAEYDSGKMYVKMTRTSPMCPVAGSLPPDVKNRVAAVEGVTEAKVDVVWIALGPREDVRSGEAAAQYVLTRRVAACCVAGAGAHCMRAKGGTDDPHEAAHRRARLVKCLDEYQRCTADPSRTRRASGHRSPRSSTGSIAPRRHHGRGHGGGRLLLVRGRAAQRLLQLRRPPPARRPASRPPSSGPATSRASTAHLLPGGQAQRRPHRQRPARPRGARRATGSCIYLPMIPELAYTMLACARIGAVHSVVFAGFSAESLRDRILDAGCKVVITANEGLRGGKRIPLKATVDQAIEGCRWSRRSSSSAAPTRSRRCAPAATSGWRRRRRSSARPARSSGWPRRTRSSSSTPRARPASPRACSTPPAAIWSTPRSTHKYVFDYHPGDIYCCAADIGWVTGHSYILYGPLANGATTVMFESIPTYPDAGRYWRMVDDLGVNIFYTAPTASGRSPAPATSG